MTTESETLLNTICALDRQIRQDESLIQTLWFHNLPTATDKVRQRIEALKEARRHVVAARLPHIREANRRNSHAV